MNPIAHIRLLLFSMVFSAAACSASGSHPPHHDSSKTTPQSAHVDSLPFVVFEKYDQLHPLLHRQNDTTYVVNFWATWCKPCVAELPWFEKLHDDMQQQPLQVLLVSMDFPKQYQSRLLPFIQERKLKPPVFALADMDYNAWIDRVSTEWDGAIPFTVIYKNQHRIFKIGELDSYEELESLVKGVMAKP